MGGENEEELGVAVGAGEVDWWSRLEELKKHKNRESRNYPMLQFFCHKGNEEKPKRHKEAKKANLKPRTVAESLVCCLAGTISFGVDSRCKAESLPPEKYDGYMRVQPGPWTPTRAEKRPGAGQRSPRWAKEMTDNSKEKHG